MNKEADVRGNVFNLDKPVTQCVYVYLLYVWMWIFCSEWNESILICSIIVHLDVQTVNMDMKAILVWYIKPNVIKSSSMLF